MRARNGPPRTEKEQSPSAYQNGTESVCTRYKIYYGRKLSSAKNLDYITVQKGDNIIANELKHSCCSGALLSDAVTVCECDCVTDHVRQFICEHIQAFLRSLTCVYDTIIENLHNQIRVDCSRRCAPLRTLRLQAWTKDARPLSFFLKSINTHFTVFKIY